MFKRSIVILILLALVTFMLTAVPTAAKEYKTGSDRAWLGVYLQDVTSDIEEAMDLSSKEGVLIADVVEDSPADKAGIEQQDVVIELDGKKVDDASYLTKLVKKHSPGDKITLKIVRDGKDKTIAVVLGERPLNDLLYGYDADYLLNKKKGAKPHSYTLSFFTGSRIGVKVQDLTEQLGQYFGVEDGEGALITEVEEDMPAEKAGLKAGDVIVEADEEKIEDTKELREIISEKEEGDKVKIKVVRNHQTRSFEVEVEEAEEWSSFDMSGFDKLRLLPEKLQAPEMLRLEKYPSDLKEEMKDLKEELDELKEELKELQEKIR